MAQSYEGGSYGDGDLGSFDPIAAHLLDQVGLAKSPEARADALAAYDAYRSNSTNETTVTPADVSPSQSGAEDIQIIASQENSL